MSAEYKCFLLVRCAILLRRHYAWSLDSSIIISIFPVLLNTALLGKCWGSVKYSLPVLVSNLTIFNINLLGIFLILSLLSLNMKKKNPKEIHFGIIFLTFVQAAKNIIEVIFISLSKRGSPDPRLEGALILSCVTWLLSPIARGRFILQSRVGSAILTPVSSCEEAGTVDLRVDAHVRSGAC